MCGLLCVSCLLCVCMCVCVCDSYVCVMFLKCGLLCVSCFLCMCLPA